MAFNTTGAQPSPLNVLGGWVTEMAAVGVPEGVSPDCQDVGFLPASVYSRPCTQKVFNPPLAPGATIVYAKSYVVPTGVVRNLYLDSNGNFYIEYWSSTPGVASLAFTTTPGSYCKSVTAFGREWIAFNDGLHGTDFPRQYDGTKFERVTQDGPGAAPVVSNLQLPAVQMAASGNTLVRMNNSVTATTATAHNLKVGYQAQISNVPDSNATTVNQSGTSASPTVNPATWDLNSGQYRSLFNPGTSALADFVASGLGFTIPSTASILGVVIGFGVNSQSSTTGTVNQVALWYSGSQEGTAKSPATAITTTVTTQSYGSSADLWGASLTPSIVNDPSFGFAVSIACDSVRVFLNFPFTVTVYYTLSGSGTVAQVSSIVINNEVTPGLALVTTTEPHGLIPGIYISLVGVEPSQVATVTAAQWSSGKTTLTTNGSHGLRPGAVVQAAGITTATGSTTFSFDGTWTIESVPAPNQVVYAQAPITATDPDIINATASTGTLSVAWPIPDDTPTPTYFEVDSCPSPTTFYIPVTYSDGTWTTGTVGFIWEGTFYVTSVPGADIFTYYQPGPNGATTAVGTVTPFGQAAPGLHLFQWVFETDEGAQTAPGPFFPLIVNGGQYIQVLDAPIGPSNVVKRILQCTGAQPDVPGELPPFFYIPVQAELEGLIVSTSTVIDDNTTTSATFDFSDNTLYAAVGNSIVGNNLVDQFTLEGALSFGYKDSRLRTWGQRNTIDNFLNMGFEGGYLSGNLGTPLGWTVGQTSPVGLLVTKRLGLAWQITLGSSTSTYGQLSQGAAFDVYGDPILDGNTTYLIRFWAEQAGTFTSQPTIIAELSSASTSFTASVTININSTTGAYAQGTFSAALPENISSDLILEFWAGGTSNSNGTVTIDDVQIINSQQPYLDNIAFASYVNNPSGFDGGTGQMQPTEDTRKLMGFNVIRGTEYWLTQDPAGRLHEVIVNPTSEPSGWEWNEIAANCGTLSAFGIAISQADDQSAGGGDDWMAWPSEGGAMMFDGGQPEKISQEIQQAWSGQQLPGVTWAQINMNAATAISALNDPVERILYFFLPTGTATTPNLIYPLYYKELNSARAIMSSPPFHPSLAGKLIATDNTRKWGGRWNLPVAGGARMYRTAPGELATVFYGGTFGNVYMLNPAKKTDDDFGQMYPYYTTHFHLDPEKALALGLTTVRLLLRYMNVYITGTGNVTYSFLINSLSNIWPLSVTRLLSSSPNFDQECAGGNAIGNRIAIKVSVSPLANTTDVQFNLQRFQTWWSKAKLSIRGAAQ